MCWTHPGRTGPHPPLELDRRVILTPRIRIILYPYVASPEEEEGARPRPRVEASREGARRGAAAAAVPCLQSRAAAAAPARDWQARVPTSSPPGSARPAPPNGHPSLHTRRAPRERHAPPVAAAQRSAPSTRPAPPTARIQMGTSELIWTELCCQLEGAGGGRDAADMDRWLHARCSHRHAPKRRLPQGCAARALPHVSSSDGSRSRGSGAAQAHIRQPQLSSHKVDGCVGTDGVGHVVRPVGCEGREGRRRVSAAQCTGCVQKTCSAAQRQQWQWRRQAAALTKRVGHGCEHLEVLEHALRLPVKPAAWQESGGYAWADRGRGGGVPRLSGRAGRQGATPAGPPAH